ncbi:MAG: response regulator [Candidatus Altiarchaeota archaeon]
MVTQHISTRNPLADKISLGEVRQLQPHLSARVSKPKILLIDDDEILRDRLQMIMVRQGWDVDLAANGMDGLEKYSPKKYDVVVCDREMPGMSGDTVIPDIKKTSNGDQVVIMLSGRLPSDEERPRIGANEYVQKPLNREGEVKVLRLIEGYIKLKQ